VTAPRPPGGLVPDVLVELFRQPLDPGYAAAAARRTVAGGSPGVGARRHRLSHRPAGTGLVLRNAMLLVTGFLLAVAYRQSVAGQPERSRVHAGLVTQVQQARARADQLSSAATALRRQVVDRQEQALDGAQIQALHQQEAATGLAPVRGDGVQVTLTDAPPEPDPNTGRPVDAAAGRVLDIDLQNVVNALWAQGAEAVAVNDQRLTTLSTIRAAGQAVLVDLRPVTSPYRVVAIGPADLSTRFADSTAADQLRAVAAAVGLGLTVTARVGLVVPAAAAVPLSYARPTGTSSGGGP
jgi:uncharacterized protein YlxW (UPF0749 family)